MSVLENSMASDNSSPVRPRQQSLCQDLQQMGGKWASQNLNGSRHDTQSESEQENSLITPNDNNKLQKQPQLQQEPKNAESPVLTQSLKQIEKQNKQEKQEQSNQSPKTITLIDELVSKQSFNVSSKFTQYSTQVDNQSFATFLSIRQTSYLTVIKSFELLFQNVFNIFSERIKNISQTFLAFVCIKYKQQKAYSSVNLGSLQNFKQCIIYLNCKTVSDQIKIKLQSQKKRHKYYMQSLEQIKNKLQKHMQTINSTMREKSSQIKQIHSKLSQIQNQMSDLMIAENRKAKKKEINPQFYSNSFVRTKYLMGRQKIYLSLIAKYLQRVLNFISYVCLQLDPKNCLVIKQCMLALGDAIGSFKPDLRQKFQQKFELLSKTHCYQQTYKQVAKLLQLCVPQSISLYNYRPQAEPKQYNEKYLKQLIEGLISESQSLVYIPVIQLQNKDYAYHSKNKATVKWVRFHHDKKYRPSELQQYETYLIITHEGHLILQLVNQSNDNQQKMAILKLKQIKISRKNNQLIITDCREGVIGYLISTKAVLGSLTFEPINNGSNQIIATQNSLIEQFIQRIKDVMEVKKEKYKKKDSLK